jgi:hypothetical protein
MISPIIFDYTDFKMAIGEINPPSVQSPKTKKPPAQRQMVRN